MGLFGFLQNSISNLGLFFFQSYFILICQKLFPAIYNNLNCCTLGVFGIRDEMKASHEKYNAVTMTLLFYLKIYKLLFMFLSYSKIIPSYQISFQLKFLFLLPFPHLYSD